MKRTASHFCLIGSTTLLSLTASQAAFSRDGDMHPSHGRDGVTFGFGLGVGNLGCSGDGCDDFTEAGSFNAFIGGMAAHNLAVTFDAWWMVHSDDDFSVNQALLTGNVRFWPIEHFWLRGGLGVARAEYIYDGRFIDVSDRSEWVPAFVVGIGVEPIATESFGLDIKLEYGTGFYSEGDTRIHSTALSVGLSFY